MVTEKHIFNEHKIKRSLMLFNLKHKQPLLYPIQIRKTLKPLKANLLLKVLSFRRQTVLLLYKVIIHNCKFQRKLYEATFFSQNDQSKLETSASEGNPFEAINHPSHFQEAETLSLLQSNRNQKGVCLYKLFTDYFNKLQNNSIVTNQSNVSIDEIFMLINITTTVSALSRPPLAPLIFAETYSLSSTDSNPFPTK